MFAQVFRYGERKLSARTVTGENERGRTRETYNRRKSITINSSEGCILLDSSTREFCRRIAPKGPENGVFFGRNVPCDSINRTWPPVQMGFCFEKSRSEVTMWGENWKFSILKSNRWKNGAASKTDCARRVNNGNWICLFLRTHTKLWEKFCFLRNEKFPYYLWNFFLSLLI